MPVHSFIFSPMAPGRERKTDSFVNNYINSNGIATSKSGRVHSLTDKLWCIQKLALNRRTTSDWRNEKRVEQ